MRVCVERGHSRNANFGKKIGSEAVKSLLGEQKTNLKSVKLDLPTRNSFDQTYL